MSMRMEGLECDVCHEIMNEDKFRPRNIKCGHTACTICLEKLIHNNTLKCPCCRQSYHVNCIDDLPVNFGVLKVIQALKGVTIPSEYVGTSTNPADKNICSIHGSLIINRCQKCQVWICENCIELHKQESGCSVTSVEDALKVIKEKHIKSTESKMDCFKHNLEVVSARIKDISVRKINLNEEMHKLKEDESKLTQLLRDGSSVFDAAVASHICLRNANNPQDIDDQVHAFLQRKCYLELWRNRNISYLELWTKKIISHASLSLMLYSFEEVYSTLNVNGTQYGARLFLKNDVVQLHTHKADPVPADAISIPYEYIRKLVESSSVTFLEISIDGMPKVELHIRLNKNMPNLAKSFTILCSGELGTNLINLGFKYWGRCYLHSETIAESSHFSQLPLDTDDNTIVGIGSIIGQTINGNLSEIGIKYNENMTPSPNIWNVMGKIIDGLPTLKSLIRTVPIENVKISNCGCIIQGVD